MNPETVVRWHRLGFALYWGVISKVRRVVGRKRISKEVRDLIFRMVAQNPTWGAPRIHGELLMLVFDISERTISCWMKRAPRDPERAKRWLAFLWNHREAIAAMDYFTVPTLSFGVLNVFFVLSHDRRQILQFNVTQHPTSPWVIQQLWEAFPFESAPRFVIFDRDGKYGSEVPAAVRSLKISSLRTSFESPWQNGVAERWVESCRHDLLDHIIAADERHLKRLLSDYVCYYKRCRTHLSLEKDAPVSRPTEPPSLGPVIEIPKVGGLHHLYTRKAAWSIKISKRSLENAQRAVRSLVTRLTFLWMDPHWRFEQAHRAAEHSLLH
jgi:putative transposase